ncbi:hypothetical protein B0J13DRAFT_457875 [Dactylonectria estremocensis]|uniref:Rhodopsin domain-containing protein n=1 Tax=Dactylonectria estremocensis TaxID=1079267 RepID=A0A9P9IH66_9HYPO|nr:hypothetical protein B0J13DRAFT_457875 [Dactylonectria estremocensis]
MGQQAPPVDDLGLHNLAIITPIFALGILLFLVRIYTRVVPTYKLNASDYMLSVAVVAEIITYSLFATAIDDGLGSPNYYLTPEVIVKISKLLFGLVFVGRWSASFARISVACLLLQFAISTGWKLILWATLCFQAATLLASELFHLLQCHPIQALWEEGPNRQCVHPKQAWIIGYLIAEQACSGAVSHHCLDGARSRCDWRRRDESHPYEYDRFHIS